ncbi:sodium:proton antiporter [Cardiobacteriaceae bacterium TAE3-ERU3]|nr:sodium:proton antiporter [Cardiobacteriaceae bacterium TAE3-ERU3]
MTEHLGLMISSLLALGIGAQWLGWFSKKPAIIYLLAIGILLGPTLHWFNPDEVLGDLLFPFVSLGVAIILFEGALTLKFQEIKSHGRVVTNLVTIGVLITIAVAMTAAWLFMDMSIELALLFGALVSVTGPTVIVPLLRSVRPNKTISNILRWEGVVIDPIGALLVVLVYEYIIAGHSPLIFAKTIIEGFSLGTISALFLATLLKRHWIPEYLHNVFTLALVLIVFSVSNYFIEESGLLSVTVMGMVLANIRNLQTDDILDFKESLSLIIISMLFIVLSARISFDGFARMGFQGILVLLAIMFIARPLSVWVSALGSKLTRNEKLLISWIAPRGIVAAAVSSLFVLKLEDSAGSDVLVPLVFTIIIGTVIIQSLTAKPLANFLGVADPNPNGVLISGINPFTIKLGKAIKENGFDVILASTSYDRTAKARMEGLNVYYGNLVSEHADRHLSLVGIGHLIALHPRNEQNMLTILRYKSEFGSRNVYRIKTNDRVNSSEREKDYSEWHSGWLFDDGMTYNKLMASDSDKAQIRTTNISDNYTFEQYQQDNPDSIPLFALNSANKLFMFSSKANFTPVKGWKIVALQPYSEEKHAEKMTKRQQERNNEKTDENSGELP